MTSRPLKWHGGKGYLAQKIVKRMPPHLVYCEPFCGGCSVLFARDPARDWYMGASDWNGRAEQRGASEIVNDIDGELMNFWRTLKNESWFRCFVRKVEATPFSEASFDLAVELERHYKWNRDNRSNPILQAWAFFTHYRQSRQGLGKDFATLSRTRTRRGMNEQVSSWLSAVEGLPEAHERLKRVVILNHDALDVIRQQDGPKTHFYCDPPYLHETRTAKNCYEHEMTPDQHACLLETLQGIVGTFQLSGYHSLLYDAAAESLGWRCVEFNLPNNASSAKTKERRVECLWMNY